MPRLLTDAVDLLNHREVPINLALVRILVCAAILFDLVWVGWWGLPNLLWGVEELDGAMKLHRVLKQPTLYTWFGLAPWIPLAVYLTYTGAAVAFGLGLATRFSGVLLVLVSAQSALINEASDRAIDRIFRITVLLLVFSGAGRMLSIDGWWRTGGLRGGSWWGDPTPTVAWPRYLLVLELTLIYFFAGVTKTSVTWTPAGGYSALYLILQDPIFQTNDWSVLAHPALYWTTQVGTAVTHLWEWTFPVVLLAFWADGSAPQAGWRGWLQCILSGLRVRYVYVAVGVIFHVLLMLTMELGIFPYLMLGLYPGFFLPSETAWLLRRLGVEPPSSRTAPSGPTSADVPPAGDPIGA